MFKKIREFVIKIKIALISKDWNMTVEEIPAEDSDSRVWIIRREGTWYRFARTHYFGNKYYWSIWSENYPDYAGKEVASRFFQRCIFAGLMEI